jgi:hypothetical protein
MICAQVPNPYYAEGSDALHYWARGLEQIYERVAQRPFESRIVWKSTNASGAHFSAMTRPCWPVER